MFIFYRSVRQNRAFDLNTSETAGCERRQLVLCQIPFRRHFSTSGFPGCSGLCARFRGNNDRGGRGGIYNGFGNTPANFRNGGTTSPRPVLIEKFVKLALFEGSVMVKHPFTIKARGSYFDENRNVDRDRNKEVSRRLRQIRVNNQLNMESAPSYGESSTSSNEPYKPQIINLEEHIASIKGATSRKAYNDSIRDIEEAISASSLSSPVQKEAADNVEKNEHVESVNDSELLNADTSSNSDPVSNLNTANSEIRTADSDNDELEQQPESTAEGELDDYELDDYDYDDDEEMEGIEVPLHVLLYGRNDHRIDCYSLDSRGKQQTHFYLSSTGDDSKREGEDSMHKLLRYSTKNIQHNCTVIS